MILYYLLAMTDDSKTANFKSLVNYDSFSKIFLLTPNFNYEAAMLPANPPIMKTIRRYA